MLFAEGRMHDDFKNLSKRYCPETLNSCSWGACAGVSRAPAATRRDIDIFLRRSDENRQKLRRRLNDFGVPVKPEAWTSSSTPNER